MDIEPKSEALSKETPTRYEYQYFNEKLESVHLCKVIFKKEPKILVYPYSYSEVRGISRKKIKTIELRGWATVEEVPPLIKNTTKKIGVTAGAVKPLMAFLTRKYPKFNKLIVLKSGKTRFGPNTITISYDDLSTLVSVIKKESRTFEVRRKTAIQNRLSEISNVFTERFTKLSKGTITHYLSFYDDISVSEADVDSMLSLLTSAPMANISITDNFIQTSNKINVAYIDRVIDEFKSLIKVKTDNEKDWQSFFEKHGWILANLFPFQVILRQKEAYVGGKTIENSEGRVVDFLFQNGFRDNYALLEIKTHKKQLLKNTPYRKPEAYAQHDDCSGAVAQCLDQKNVFLTELGKPYKVLDPKVILIIGMKSALSESQKRSFELLRNNQKNVDIVTFDELQEKLIGLRSVLQS